jgi:hypothetical protein
VKIATIALMIFMRSIERSIERAHGKKVRERANMSAITLTRSNDQHLYKKYALNL